MQNKINVHESEKVQMSKQLKEYEEKIEILEYEENELKRELREARLVTVRAGDFKTFFQLTI